MAFFSPEMARPQSPSLWPQTDHSPQAHTLTHQHPGAEKGAAFPETPAVPPWSRLLLVTPSPWPGREVLIQPGRPAVGKGVRQQEPQMLLSEGGGVDSALTGAKQALLGGGVGGSPNLGSEPRWSRIPRAPLPRRLASPLRGSPASPSPSNTFWHVAELLPPASCVGARASASTALDALGPVAQGGAGGGG